MITIPKRKCSKVNCQNLVEFNIKFCNEHKQLKNESRKQYDKQRYSNDKQVRQTYNSTTWKHIRKGVMLRDNSLCMYCLYRGTYTKATLVDHFIPIRDAYELRYDTNNLVASCDKCNTRKAIDEDKLRKKEITFEQFKERWAYEINRGE